MDRAVRALFSDGTSEYRFPTEPAAGETVRLRFRALKDSVNEVVLCIGGERNVTPKMSATINGGYDITNNKLTTSSISISRDLHCWQMSFSWVPFGHYKSWSFHIGVKASSLQDLKYDKSQSMYDNYF